MQKLKQVGDLQTYRWRCSNTKSPVQRLSLSFFLSQHTSAPNWPSLTQLDQPLRLQHQQQPNGTSPHTTSLCRPQQGLQGDTGQLWASGWGCQMCTLTCTTAVQPCLCRWTRSSRESTSHTAWDLWDLPTGTGVPLRPEGLKCHGSVSGWPITCKKTQNSPGRITTRNLSPVDLLPFLRAAGSRPFCLDYLAYSSWWYEPCDCTLPPAQHPSGPACCFRTAIKFFWLTNMNLHDSSRDAQSRNHTVGSCRL